MLARSSTRGRRALRVAVLDHTAELGGAELALARLATAIDPDDVELRVVAFSPGPLIDQVRQAGHHAEVVALDPGMATMERASTGRLGNAIGSTFRLLPFIRRLSRRIRELEVDLIHTTSLKADLIGVPVALICRRPLVWHVHDRIARDYLPAPMVRLVRALARTAPTHVIVNSAATAATLPCVRRLTVAHPGLGAEQVAEAPRFSPPPGPPVVGIVGRISPTKAQLDFVRAAGVVSSRHPEARFRVVGAASFGAGDYERQVREEVARLGLTDRFVFTGFVDDPVREIDAMSVCVHTASVPEPFGQVVAEAMARGVPVVATSGGGVDEILKPDTDEPLGWLVPPGDVAALAAAIDHALRDQGEADRRAQAGWRAVRSRFQIADTAVAIVAVWRRVASDGRR